jgi:hypothetical protein
MNKYLEFEADVTRAEALPFYPVPDSEGWYPVNETQSVEQIIAYSERRKKDARESVVERFEELVRECRADSSWQPLDAELYLAEAEDEQREVRKGERRKVSRLLEGMGFKSKAERFADCEVKAVPVDCLACGEKYFSRYRCTLRYCENCGPWHFSRLMQRYLGPITNLIKGQGSQRGRTLAKLNFTVRASNRMPHPSEPRRLMKMIRRWFKRMMPTGELWGCVFAVETGHELAVKHPGRKAGGWNLHVHALYYGPFLDQPVGLRLWKELLIDSGGFSIKQCWGWKWNTERAVRRALIHHFGYILKPSAVSAERIAALEILFAGVRRVHTLGCFYKLPKPERKSPSARCPKCGQSLPVNLRVWHRSERFDVTRLEAEGRRDARQLERERRRAMAFGGEGS